MDVKDVKGSPRANMAGMGSAEREELGYRLINNAVVEYAQSHNAHIAINTILQDTAAALDVAHVMVLEPDITGERVIIQYEWSAGHVRDVPRLAPFDTRIWLEWQHAGGTGGIATVSDIKLNPPGAGICGELGDMACMQCFSERDGVLASSMYIGDRRAREWTEREKSLLVELARVVDIFLYDMRRVDSLKRDLVLSRTPEEYGYYSYLLREGTHELLQTSENVCWPHTGARPGEICYHALYGRDTPCEECPLERAGKGSVERYNDKMNTWYELSTRSVELEDGPATLVMYRDISRYKRHAVDTDELTGFALYPRFKKEVENRVRKTGVHEALLYLHLEEFVEINSKYGIKRANYIMQEMARYMWEHVCDPELMCRYFSDVFLLFVTYDRLDELQARVEKSAEMFEEWREQTIPDVVLTSTCGVYPVTDASVPVDKMVENAGVACMATEAGGKYAVFDERMRTRNAKEKDMAGNMHQALQRDEFVIYIQPKVDLSTRRISGGEALIRWRGEHVNLLPSEFIPLFEKTGFIQKMDFYMVEQVLSIIQGWVSAGKKVVPISINLADANIKDESFVERMTELLQKYHIPPGTIEIELRDYMFDWDRDALVRAVNSLRKLGVMFSVNNLGIGSGWVAMQRAMPVDVLKLGKELFESKHLSERERSMLLHIVRLAKSVDMRVLCEGVEEEEQAEALRSAGCDLAQGYLFGGPVTQTRFAQMVDMQG